MVEFGQTTQNFSARKKASIQLTTSTTQFTTNSPSKHHLLPHHFRQNTLQNTKNSRLRTRKKNLPPISRKQSAKRGSNIVQTMTLPRLAIEKR
jgi:hypothetical protein